MNVTLGLYDIFAHLLPGVLVIYTVNEMFVLLKLPSISIDRMSNPAYLVLFLIAGYVLGNFLYLISDKIWYHRVYRSIRKRALADVQERSAYLDIRFRVDDVGALIEILRIRNMQALKDIERLKVNSVMMRNLIVFLPLYALYQIISIVVTGDWLPALLVSITALLFLPFAYRSAQLFDRWYYRAVFQQALCYGKNLKEVLSNEKPFWKMAQKPRRRTTNERDKTSVGQGAEFE